MHIIKAITTALLGLFGLGENHQNNNLNTNDSTETTSPILRHTSDDKMILHRLVSVGTKKLQFRSRQTGQILTAKILSRRGGEFLVQRGNQSFYVSSRETVTVPAPAPGTFWNETAG